MLKPLTLLYSLFIYQEKNKPEVAQGISQEINIHMNTNIFQIWSGLVSTFLANMIILLYCL